MLTLGKDIGTLTLDDLKLWSSRSLKVYLSLRGKPTSEIKLLCKYKAKLSINDKFLPDPIDLKECWVGQEAG